MRPGETPVPIPNTMVKPREADGTALETMWESRWPPALKKKRQIRCRRSYRYRHRWATTYRRQPGQQGSAVMIAGFTSDQIRKRDFEYVMTDKTSVRNVLTLHLKNFVLSVACRHAIKQNILKLMEASFQRIKYLFCNVPWKPHIRNWWKYQDIRGNCYKQETVVTITTLWRKQSKKIDLNQHM